MGLTEGREQAEMSHNKNNRTQNEDRSICVPQGREIRKWNGDSEKLDRFIADLYIYFGHYRRWYEDNDERKIITASSFMEGPAGDWVNPRCMNITLGQLDIKWDTYEDFVKELRETFGDRFKEEKSRQAILRIKQGKKESVLDYRLRFQDLAFWTGFNDVALLTCAREGLWGNILSIMENSDQVDKSLEDMWERAISVEYRTQLRQRN